MKVSIIIPVFNVEKYILRCLYSVVSQTYKDIECLIIDDCGTDKSITFADEFIKKNNGNNSGITFKIIHHNTNSGLSAARNTGIKEAIGEYLYFLDSDDSITPDCIETLVRLTEKYPDITFAQGNLLDEGGGISKYGFHFDVPEYINQKEELSYYLLSKITTSACNRLINKSIIYDHSLYFPNGILHEDMYWVYFLSKYTNAAAFTPKGLYTYYINEGSIMNSISPLKRIARYQSRLVATKDYLHDIKETKNANKYQRQYIAVNLMSCIVELSALHSITHWFHFWRTILTWGYHNIKHISLYRSIFLIQLFPPICFVAGNNKIRWRIQKYIIKKL